MTDAARRDRRRQRRHGAGRPRGGQGARPARTRSRSSASTRCPRRWPRSATAALAGTVEQFPGGQSRKAMQIMVEFLEGQEDAGPATRPADPDRDHQGQSRQGRAARRGEVDAALLPGRPASPLAAGKVRMTAPDRRPLLRMTGISQELPRRAGAARTSTSRSAAARCMRCSARTAPASRRCSRSWPAPSAPDAGTIALRRRARCALASPHDGAGARHRHHLPGVQPRPEHVGRRERVHRPRAGARPASSTGGELRRRDARASPREVGLDRRPAARWSRDLSVAEQQMVEIARALSMDAKLIVMDEPTSALVRRRGRAAVRHHPRPQGARASRVVFVTHRLEEVMRDLRPRSRSCATARWSARPRSREIDDRRHHPP